MEAAINSLVDESIPVLRTARKYGIPKPTPYFRKSTA